MSERTVAAVALGSNLGDREQHLKRAQALLEKTPGVVLLRRSAWHETEPVGGPEGQGPYLNGAALLETTLGAEELLAALHAIEDRLGRDRASEGPDGARTLDLDLLWFGDEVCDTDALRLPHPRMEERLFVLAPLAEVAPDHSLPGCGRTVRERLEELRAAAEQA
jgi:2-amino-4-hydroxy-6-hydroxymethyldihydropteridine diphosphokinase